jgi:hypothetical protein
MTTEEFDSVVGQELHLANWWMRFSVFVMLFMFIGALMACYWPKEVEPKKVGQLDTQGQSRIRVVLYFSREKYLVPSASYPVVGNSIPVSAKGANP